MKIRKNISNKLSEKDVFIKITNDINQKNKENGSYNTVK